MVFTKRQTKIFEKLESLDPKIAKAFKGGIDVLEENNPERMVHSAQSLREVIYMLSRLDEIKKFGRVQKASEGKNRKRDLIKNLDPVRGTPDNAYILYDDLNDKSHWFASVAHHSEFPSEKKFRKKIDEFEKLLEKTFQPHFEVINEIKKLLNIKKPTKNNFNNLKKLISRNSSAYNYFFQNATAEWLPFLLKDKYLKNPLHIIEVDGEKRFAVWPPAIYIWKTSSKKPEEVSKIILNLDIPKGADKRNPWLLDYFIKAAINMPPKYGKLIAKKIYSEKWIQVSYHNYLEQPISELMKKLADAGFENETIMLAKSILNVKLGEPYITGGILEKPKQVQDVKPIVDSYWYGQLLEKEIPYVFEKFPKTVTSLLIQLVRQTIFFENKGKGKKNSKTDISPGWRPAIEDHEQNPERDFRSQLLGKLGHFVIKLGTKSIPLLKHALKETSKIEYPAFRRLEIFAYWNFPKYFRKEINYSIIHYFNNYEVHHEYFHLLKNTFSFASIKTRKKYLSFVEKGPDNEHLEFWKQQSENQKPEFIDLKIRFWKSDKLNPIIEHLANDEKEKFGDLVVSDKEFPSDFHAYTSKVVTSQPVTELKDDSHPADVFEFIKSYEPKERGFGFHDGTAEKFQDHVHKNPETYSKLALRLENLDPIFTHKFFRAIEECIKGKKTVEWKSTLLLCEKIIKSIKEGKYRKQNEFNILNSIASLLDRGVEFDSINFLYRKKLWKLLKELTILEDTDSSWEKDYPREDWDAFGISINTVNGITFHAIMKYSIWCKDHLKKKIFVPEVKLLISNYLEQKLPNTVSRQAVLGYHLATLYYFDKIWIRTKLFKLFKNQNEILSRAAWDGYLIGKPYIDIFSDLLTQYSIHIRKLNSPPLKDGRLWDSDERVIDHVTVAYLFQFQGSEKLFNYMITNSHEKVVSHCAWYVGRILKWQKEKSNKAFNSKAFRQIWKNNKLTSNEDLRTWVEYSPFDKNETLQLLYNSLKKSTKSIRFLSFLVEELELYAKTHPVSTFKCLNLLIQKRVNDPEFYIAREKLKSVLQILLNNNKTTKKTIGLIHYLGELGFNEYNDLLKNKTGMGLK